ncbi:MAG: LysE family translocator [Eubacteriales bacterium]|nr:LysE family translocator [Eubacteriales bacterium]
MRKVGWVWRGLRFGMLLQLAVGPVCLLTLSAAGTRGFWPAMSLVAAVTLADAFYVFLSSLGVAAILGRPRVKAVMKALGGGVLILFGLDAALGVLGVPLLPGVSLFSVSADANLFWQGLIVTLSNPLTILFWGGMLTARVMENPWSRAELSSFAAGCVLATLLFLTAIAALGSCFTGRVPEAVIKGLNVGVGIALIYFGLRLWLKKEKEAPPASHADIAC